jgi:peroxiredoxin
MAAPEFRLLDQFDNYISLRGFLGRHQIVLAFFDARTGPEADPTLKQLMRFLPALKQAGVVVLAISAPLTPEQKQNARRLPFSVLRDTPAGHPGSVCLTWGTARATAGQTGPGVVSPAVFLIRRDGFVESDGGVPRPADDPGLLIRQLLNE